MENSKGLNNNRRNRFLVNQFQSQLLRRFVTYWVVYQVTMWNFLFLWYVWNDVDGKLPEQFRRFFVAHYPMLICFVVLVPFFAYDALKFSHRLAGPVFRIRGALQSIASGRKIQPIKLRTNDYLQEVTDDLNLLVALLEQQGFLTPSAADPAPIDSRFEAEIGPHSEPLATASDAALTSCGICDRMES